MDRPFAAYTGDEPYVFVSYSHDNSSVVFPELAWLKESGFNIWYDEGIEAVKPKIFAPVFKLGCRVCCPTNNIALIS